jgi:GNAT superfamily N-acetyltransferase
MDTLTPAEIAEIAEFGEANAMADMYAALSPELRRDLGAGWERRGGAVVLLMRQVPYILFNRVIGLGLQEPASTALLDDLLALFAAQGARAAVQLSPTAQPADLPGWLEARGFHPEDAWIKFVRGVEPPADVPTDLRIECISAAQAPAFAAVFAEVFGIPDPVQAWLAGCVERPGWRHYVAFDGAIPAATGALYVADGIGWLGMAATRPAARRRGAQGAIIARRIRDAAALGCRWLAVETARDTPEHPNPSTHNLRRLGFQFAYHRLNYIR